LGPHDVNFGFCRQCDVVGGELVPPALLGWYFIYCLLYMSSMLFSCLMKLSSSCLLDLDHARGR